MKRQKLKREAKVFNVMRRIVQTSFIAMVFFAGMITNEYYLDIPWLLEPVTVAASEMKKEEVDKQEETKDNQVKEYDFNVFQMDDIALSFEPALSREKLYVDSIMIDNHWNMLSKSETVKVETEEVTTKMEEPYENVEISVSVLHKEPELPEIQLSFEDITVTSNATKEQIDAAVRGTWLEPYSQLYYDLEQEYGVNALIAIATAIQETGWEGNSRLAVERNNIYGILNGSFKSKEDCIRYYFKLISSFYVPNGYRALDKINVKYCPPDPTWSNDIFIIATKLNNKIQSTFT